MYHLSLEDRRRIGNALAISVIVIMAIAIALIVR